MLTVPSPPPALARSRFARSLALVALAGLLAVPAVSAPAQDEEAEETEETEADSELPPGEAQRKSVPITAGGEAPYVHNINLLNEDGQVIDPSSSNDPYSPAETCGQCHNVEATARGWHHNAADPDFDADGRPGEPFFWVDPHLGTQLPVSERDWPGTYDLETVGLTAWDFTLQFAGQTPGGGIGGRFRDQVPEADHARWDMAGELGVDCLSCHLDDGAYNYRAWNEQIDDKNLKWAATAAAPFATVSGSVDNVPEDFDPLLAPPGGPEELPEVDYREAQFTGRRVRLDITNDVSNEACYNCHSQEPTGPDAVPRWHQEEDIHMSQGMNCVDCHRNGINHMTNRGYPDDPAVDPADAVAAGTLSCQGCHMGTEQATGGTTAAGGRMAAPRPEHKGIPPIHFETMTCTSCHSGPAADQQPGRLQTSLGHELVLSSEYRTHRTLPHMVWPLFLENEQGKLAPHRAVWPAFWGTENEQGEVTPLPVERVGELLEQTLPEPGNEEHWHALSKQQIAEALGVLLDEQEGEGEPVYVSGGRIYRLTAAGEEGQNGEGQDAETDEEANQSDQPALAINEGHPAAAPYTWPIAHDVRPAAQSLGAGSCKGCHSTDSPVDFGPTADPTWAQAAAAVPTVPEKKMHELRGQDTFLLYVWSQLFQMRSSFKILAVLSTFLVGGVLVAYGGVGLRNLLRRWSRLPRVR